jgi:diacylglycerol kinase (ATP)
MMERKLLYLVNPISGTGKKAVLVDSIHELTQNSGLGYEIAYTNAEGDYSDVCRRIRDEYFTDVVVCGGDGTVSSVTSHLLHTNVNVGIIPMGSGNGLALTARIPYSIRKSLQIIFDGRADWIDGFRVNGKFACMMCGIGNDADIAHEFALTKVRGLKTYLLLSARKYLNLKPYLFTINSNGMVYTISSFFITISNSNQFGNYITIAPRASLNDGLLDVVVVAKMHKALLPFALFRQIAGINRLSDLQSSTAKKEIVYFQTRELIITNTDHAPLHIDGEPHVAVGEIRIEIVPNAFRLLQPFREPVMKSP